jgi:tetratricopeptide (TPR) repeat protein
MVDTANPDAGEAGRLEGIREAILGGATNLAIQHLNQWLVERPERADYHLLLGVALEQEGRPGEAKAAFQQAARLAPNDPAPLLKLQRVAVNTRALTEELLILRALLALKPNDEKVLRRLLDVECATNDFAAGAKTAQRILALSPDDVTIAMRGVWCLYEHGDKAEAMAALDLLIEVPDPSDICILGWAKIMCDRESSHLEAVPRLRGLCDRLPNHSVTWACLGKALAFLEREKEALAAFRRSIELDPNQPAIWFDIGVIERQRGELTASMEALERCLRLQPMHVSALRILGGDHRHAYGDEAFTRINRALANVEGFSQLEQVELHYAAGKAFEDVGEIDTAFAHYRNAGRLEKQLTPWSEIRMKGVLTLMSQFMSPAELAAARAQGARTNQPVFVFGMPRSGTTLIEQVIASHPQAFGAGELTLGAALLSGVKAGRVTIETNEKPNVVFPVPPRDMSIPQRGAAYLAEIRRLAGGDFARIVDKMPSNYYWVGLLDAILPGCFLIHSRRHPVETCLSAYRLFFPQGLPWSSDLRDLGKCYRQYIDYMNFWSSMLPKERILHVRYEDMVTDFETQARRLISFIGLPWDDACLRFYESERKVLTASVTQVRRPIYTGSINRWRKYEQHLKPLLDELGPLVREYEEELEGKRPPPFGG